MKRLAKSIAVLAFAWFSIALLIFLMGLTVEVIEVIARGLSNIFF